MGFANSLGNIADAAELNKIVEKEKKNYRGREIAGKTLGVLGLGLIPETVSQGSSVVDFGHHVLGALVGRMLAIPVEGCLQHVGTPEGLREAQQTWTRRRFPVNATLAYRR